MKDDAVYLRHIMECIRRIEENAAGGRDQFMASHTLQDAVLRNLQTMAEATQHLSEAVKATRPEIEWVRIAAFRNVLVHNYLGIDMDANDLTRRKLLRWLGTAGASCFLGEAVRAGENLRPATTAVDHLLLGVADLDRGMAWVERRTGVKAVIGGSHPGVGTRNALVSLQRKQYLEIIAPDPAQSVYNFPIDIRTLTEPRLITWAAAATDINATAKKARDAGYEVFGPRDGSRARPDGKVLKWKTLGVVNKFGLQGVEPIPFFIAWAVDSLHPSQDAPKGCQLRSLEIEHPDPANVMDMLKKLGIAATIKPARKARLIATLETPRGKVELS